nr:hypothetical protein [Tanacetum cinerariifolium]
MAKFFAVLLLALITISMLQAFVSANGGHRGGFGPGSLKSSQCGGECIRRCSKTQYHKPCMFFCQKCCAKCLCVPPGGLPEDKKKYNKSSKGNEVLQRKPLPNTKSFVRRLPKEVAKEKGLVKPKATPVESKVGKTKILVEDKELKDERDSDVEGSDGESDSDKEHKVSEEADVSNESEEEEDERDSDVEGNESEKDSESEEDKETEVSKESDDSELWVKDVKIKGVKGNKMVAVSKAKKRMHVSDSSSEEDNVSKLKKVSKKKKQIKKIEYLDDLPSLRSRTVPSSLFAAIHDSQVDMESFLSDIGFLSLHNVYIDTLLQQFSRFMVRAFSASSYEFKLEKGIIRVTPEKVHEILGVPLALKKIRACDIAEKLVLTKTVDFMFKVNFLMLFSNVMGTADTMKAIVNLTVLRRIHEDTNIAGVDWCGFIHKFLQGSSEPNTVGGFYIGPLCFLILLYLDSTKFDEFLVIRQRPVIRNRTTTAMNRRQELEIQKQVIGKLDLHGEWTESELDQTEGFYNVGENVSWTHTSSVPPTDKKLGLDHVRSTGGLPEDTKKYNKSSKGNEVLQPKPLPNTKSSVRRLPKEVAKEKGPVKPKTTPVESKVGKTKILVEDKELKDERDYDVEGSDGESDSDKEHKVSEEADVSNESEEEGNGVKTKVFKVKEIVVVSKFKKRNEEDERDSDVEGNESEKDSESEEDKETEVSKESDDSELWVKDVKIKGVKGNKMVVVSKAKKRMHVSDSSSEEDKVSKLKKVSKKKKQIKKIDYLDDLPSMRSRTVPSSLFAAIHDSQVDMESFLSDIGFLSLHNVYIDTLPQRFARFVVRAFSASSYEFKLEKVIIRVTPEKVHEILGVPLGGNSIFDLPEIPLDDPFVKEWFKQFDPKPLKKICACDIAEKLVLTKIVNFMFKINFHMLFLNVMGTTDTMKAIVNLTVLRRIHEDTNIAGIDWCGFIHKFLQGSSKPNTLLYLDSTKFDEFLVIRQRPAIRNRTTTAMNRRQELEIQKQVIGKLDLHGEWTESELDQTEGFYNVGENVSWTHTSSVPHTDKKTFCSMIEEKISMISAEKIALEDLSKKANANSQMMKRLLSYVRNIKDFFKESLFVEDFQAHIDDSDNNDDDEGCKNDDHGSDNVGKKKESVAKDVVNVEKDRLNAEKDGMNDVQEGEADVNEKPEDMLEKESFTQWIEKNIDWVGETPQRVVTRASPNKRIVKPHTYLTSPYMNKRTKVTSLIKRLKFVLGNSLFSMQGDKYETVFQTRFGHDLSSVRLNMETLAPRLWIDAKTKAIIEWIIDAEHQ